MKIKVEIYYVEGIRIVSIGRVIDFLNQIWWFDWSKFSKIQERRIFFVISQNWKSRFNTLNSVHLIICLLLKLRVLNNKLSLIFLKPEKSPHVSSFPPPYLLVSGAQEMDCYVVRLCIGNGAVGITWRSTFSEPYKYIIEQLCFLSMLCVLGNPKCELYINI